MDQRQGFTRTPRECCVPSTLMQDSFLGSSRADFGFVFIKELSSSVLPAAGHSTRLQALCAGGCGQVCVCDLWSGEYRFADWLPQPPTNYNSSSFSRSAVVRP